jgi:hypothetical protein
MHSACLMGNRFDAFALLDGERFEGFILQPGNVLAFVMIAYPSFEADVTAGAGVENFAACCSGVDRGVRKSKLHQPPATGGMNTTASPAASLCDQSANSLLTATFNCSRDRVNP